MIFESSVNIYQFFLYIRGVEKGKRSVTKISQIIFKTNISLAGYFFTQLPPSQPGSGKLQATAKKTAMKKNAIFFIILPRDEI